MAGQAKKGAIIFFGKDGWLAGSNGHTMGEEFGAVEFLENGQGEITFANRTAA